MFTIDVLGNLERLSIYLCRPSGELLTCLDEYIDEQSASITIGVNQQYNLSFSMNKSADVQLATWYDYMQEGMYLFVEKIGLFKMSQPTISTNGIVFTKSVSANSCDVELEDKVCTLSVNMGTKESMEYLVTYDEDETELLANPYTNIPYDWIVLYNTFPEQLSIELEKVDSHYYGILNHEEEIVVTDKKLIEELLSLFSSIPRLKSKMVETKDEATGLSSYSLVEYAIIENDSENNIVEQIILTKQYIERIEDLIAFYTKYRNQLSLLSIVLEKTGGNWSVGEIFGVPENDFSLANKKFQFEINETIYSFLTQTLAQVSECIINFDITKRKVNATPAENVGDNTGIVLSYETLMNSLNVSFNDDKLTTRLTVTGSEELGIEQVNFGSAVIDNILYKINAKDSNGKRIYVTDEFAEKYLEFVEYREQMREEYIQLSKDYRRYSEQISELQYRVPNDALSNDWSTYSLEELEDALTNYKNLLLALITLYKEDYTPIGLNSDGSVNESYIKTTMYWHDYEAYKNIINEITCAIDVFPFYSNQDEWKEDKIDKYKELITAWETEWTLYGSIELQAKIDSYKANLELLLESSVIPYTGTEQYTEHVWERTTQMVEGDKASATALFFNNFDLIAIGDGYFQTVYPISITNISDSHIVLTIQEKDKEGKTTFGLDSRYNSVIPEGTIFNINDCNVQISYGVTKVQPPINMTLRQTTSRARIDEYDIKSWKELSTSEKAEYGTELNYQYDAYMKYYKLYHSAKEYLAILLAELDELKEAQETAQSRRNELVKSVQIESYFTEKEVEIINLFYRDSEYSNENILITSINTSDEKIDIMKELLDDGNNKLFSFSRPQLNFTISSDNLLGLKEFKALWKSFKPGNYMLIQYEDDTYIKLRMVGYTFNPCLPTSNSLDITFSNQIRAKAGVSDLESLLGLAEGGYSSGGGGSSSSGNGVGDDIDATISNTMLSKLLNSESFGTRVTNVILDTLDLNVLTSKLATFGGLSSGTTVINGKCLQTGYIVDELYNGIDGGIDNTIGTVINLETGLFKMAGGALTWDGGSLVVEGALVAETLSAGGKTSEKHNANGLFVDINGNLYSGDNNQTQIFSDGRFSFGNGNLTWNGQNLVATGTIYAKAGSFGKTNPFVISDNGLDGSTSSNTHTSTISTTRNIDLYNSASSSFNRQFQIVISQSGKTDALNDIYAVINELTIDVEVSYQIVTQVTETHIVDTSGSEGSSSDDDDAESTGSGDSSNVVTTTTTTTTDYSAKTTNTLISSATNISSQMAIALSGSTKTYTYTHTLTTGNMNDYLISICRNKGILPSNAQNIVIRSASISISYSHYFTSYTLVSHIGTDYLSYSNALTVRNGVVTLGSTTVDATLNVNGQLMLNGQNMGIYGYMATNDGWRMFGGGSSDAGYLEISTKDNGNEPIYIRQYSGNFATLTRTLTLLDGSGNTTMPGVLNVRYIKSTSTYLDIQTTPVITSGILYLGYSNATGERQVRFAGTSSGTYLHNSYLYGGNTASTTAIGMYDGKNSRGILVYNDTNYSLSVAGCANFYFKDYSGTTRQPVASTSADGKRLANIGSKSTGLTVYGQWGTAGAKFTAKTVKHDSSDIRLKENIGECEIESALDVISQLKLHSFDWIDYDEDLPRHQRIGFVADEIELIDSKFTFGGGYDEDGILNVKGVDTFYMMGYVIKAIQELQQENKELRKLIQSNHVPSTQRIRR